MKQSILASLLLIPTLLLAEPVELNKRVVCDKTAVVFHSLLKDHGERPIWVGVSKEDSTVVVSNPRTGSWSIVLFNDKVACVLEAGEKNQILPEALNRKQLKHED